MVAVYGGMFDPPHRAHVALVEAALAARVCDRVLVMVASQTPPHRPPPVATAGLRVGMARAAFGHLDRVEVSELELRRTAAGGSSFMVDTLAEAGMAPDLRGSRFVLLLGADQLVSFHRWHRWEELLQQVSLAVAERPDHTPQPEFEAAIERLTSAGGTVVRFAMEPSPASSTRIRELLLAGRADAAAEFVPEGVQPFLRRAYGA